MQSSKIWSILSKPHPFSCNIAFGNLMIISFVKPCKTLNCNIFCSPTLRCQLSSSQAAKQHGVEDPRKMECMLSMSVFGPLRRLRIGEDSLRGDDIVGCFIFCYLLFILTSSMQSSPLVSRQTWCLTGDNLAIYIALSAPQISWWGLSHTSPTGFSCVALRCVTMRQDMTRSFLPMFNIGY